MNNLPLPSRRGVFDPFFSVSFSSSQSANPLVFKDVSEYCSLNFDFRDQVLQVTPRTDKDMKFLDDLRHNKYNFEVL